MNPKAIRVFPLSKTKEPEAFGTIDKAYDFFLNCLPKKNPPGRFNIPSEKSVFKKNTLILFQYSEKKNQEKIIAHAILDSDGCIRDDSIPGYIGYYLLNLKSIVFYNNSITKEEIYNIWKKTLFQSKLKLDVSRYDDYVNLLKNKGN